MTSTFNSASTFMRHVRFRLRSHIIAGVTLLIASAAIAADLPQFAAAAAKSAEKFKTDQGRQYGVAFMKSAGRALVPAAQACKGSAAQIGSYHDIVFIVTSSGRIEHIIHGQHNVYGDCITSHLRMPKSVARPPTDSWPVHVRFLHGVLGKDDQLPFMVLSDDATGVASAPPDKPVRAAGGKQIDALAKAEEPYIAKGRATYPAAKKRFLAGLPRNYRFEVRKRLTDPDGIRFEEVFIEVDAVKDGNVYGRIGNELGVVRSYRQWQRISFPESEVLDWTIVHPDGREEGNFVGKFIDDYKPQ